MAWKEEMVNMLRYNIDDYTTPYVYDDRSLEELLAVAAHFVNETASFSKSYVVDVGAFEISPDPTVSPKDVRFMNLVVLKSACMLAGGEVKSASRKALVVRDGPSSIDGKGIVAALKEWQKEICKMYEKEMIEHRTGKHGVAIVGPYNLGNGPGSTHPLSSRSRSQFVFS